MEHHQQSTLWESSTVTRRIFQGAGKNSRVLQIWKKMSWIGGKATFWSRRLWNERDYLLKDSNLNSRVPSAGSLWALCCLHSLAPHQCVSNPQGLFRPASSKVVIKRALLTNCWTYAGFYFFLRQPSQEINKWIVNPIKESNVNGDERPDVNATNETRQKICNGWLFVLTYYVMCKR